MEVSSSHAMLMRIFEMATKTRIDVTGPIREGFVYLFVRLQERFGVSTHRLCCFKLIGNQTELKRHSGPALFLAVASFTTSTKLQTTCKFSSPRL